MAKPENFISNSDYATLKNDSPGPGTISVTLTPITLTAGQLYTATNTLTIGAHNASSRVRIASSKDGGTYYAGSVFIANRTGQTAGPFDVPYDVIGYLTRTSPTVVTATVAVTNPYAEDMIMATGDEVFTFEISTFLSPFV